MFFASQIPLQLNKYSNLDDLGQLFFPEFQETPIWAG
jgi:hypothetical protein